MKLIDMAALYEKGAAALYLAAKPVLEMWSRLEGPDGMWAGRLGDIPAQIAAAGPYDIWMQAVSVGEVAVAEAIVKAIDMKAPGVNILISATTPAGFARAASSLAPRCSVIPYPMDFPQVVKKAVRTIRPRVYACIETELWPNFVRAVHGLGSVSILINGRISERSFARYKKIKSITRPLLNKFSMICAISEVHAERLNALGAPMERIVITGNAKFEGLITRPDQERLNMLRSRMGIDASMDVFVAGSLRKGEEKLVVDACSSLLRPFPDLIFFLVPRHLKRVSSIISCLKQAGMSFQLWSGLEAGGRRVSQVVVVDVVGPLFDIYGLASVSFVGGSLVPKGGQNIMEPAAWACPVLYGPYVDNFEEAKAALDASGGGLEVRNAVELADALGSLLKNPVLRNKKGLAARAALVELSQGAASRQADMLIYLLQSGLTTR
ncbi:MAG: 3-deoxy-D-manno-octulosonic acid transferase [Dissulfurimicrobium sp.]|uniref:3-deoxy-D-manno-octulosonic acid transferase n=1 Tax=Dissulfurimicrobium sp. TaxID=2022436 RepID=UPI004049214A